MLKVKKGEKMLIQIVTGYANQKINDAFMFNGASFCPEDFLHPRDVIKWLHKEIRDIRAYDKKFGSSTELSIGTHSDYILKEINTLFMLGKNYVKNPGTTMAFLKEYGYEEYTPELFLSAEEIICTDTSEEENEVLIPDEELGYEFKTFDLVINRMNSIQEHLQFGTIGEGK